MVDLPDPANVHNVWEPACGDGAMTHIMRGYGFHVVGSDIRSDGIELQALHGVDFLSVRMAPFTMGRVDWIITNPPFNRAEDFIRHALTFTPNVAMLLKSQFWHALTRAKLFGEHGPAAVLPLTWRPDFLDGDKGGAPTMDCAWTVWGGRDVKALAGFHGATLYQPLMRPGGARKLI